MSLPMLYCSQCGSAAMQSKIPSGDTLLRQVCGDCGFVFYSNPKVVVGAVTTFNDNYLLCKRNIEPQKGYWTYPAGFLENNETVEEGAIRETLEEAEARIKITRLLGVYSLTSVNQVHLIYAATMQDGHFNTTDESSEVKLVAASDIPWDELAFPVIKWALKSHLNPDMQSKVDSKSTALSLADSMRLD